MTGRGLRERQSRSAVPAAGSSIRYKGLARILRKRCPMSVPDARPWLATDLRGPTGPARTASSFDSRFVPWHIAQVHPFSPRRLAATVAAVLAACVVATAVGDTNVSLVHVTQDENTGELDYANLTIYDRSAADTPGWANLTCFDHQPRPTSHSR